MQPYVQLQALYCFDIHLYLVFTEEPAEGGTPRHCSQSKRKGCVIRGGLYTVYGTATIHGIASIIINVIRVEKQEELLHQCQQAHGRERGALRGIRELKRQRKKSFSWCEMFQTQTGIWGQKQVWFTSSQISGHSVSPIATPVLKHNGNDDFFVSVYVMVTCIFVKLVIDQLYT